MTKLGYLQDPRDPRDFVFDGSLAARPSPVAYEELANGFDRLLVQQAQSCVGFSIAEALYAAWRYQGIEQPKLASALFIWWNSRQQHACQTIDSGTYIRVAMKQLSRLGFCAEENWPSLNGQDAQNFDVKPPHLAYRAAIDQQMSSMEFYRIDQTGDARVEAWKAALSSGHPIVFGMPVRTSYLSLGQHDVYGGLLASMGQVVGGHAQCALGYDQAGPYGPGTWGPDWGNHGWWHLSWDHISVNAIDQWAIRVPQYFSERETSR